MWLQSARSALLAAWYSTRGNVSKAPVFRSVSMEYDCFLTKGPAENSVSQWTISKHFRNPLLTNACSLHKKVHVVDIQKQCVDALLSFDLREVHGCHSTFKPLCHSWENWRGMCVSMSTRERERKREVFIIQYNRRPYVLCFCCNWKHLSVSVFAGNPWLKWRQDKM